VPQGAGGSKKGMSDATPQDTSPNTTPTAVGDYLTPALVEYGTYVLCARAVGDVRDGLKPVQRRLLWEAHQQRAFSTGNFRKCAKLVGGTIGNWHPHGDQSTYGTLVGLTKDRYPLFEGHGNFGTDSDPSFAAYRYTEARLSAFGERLFDDLAATTLTDNYDGTQQEPVTLPARLPLALLNGFEGIAVGLNTNVPPHNLVEVVQALSYLLQHPDAPTRALHVFLRGPDYGSGVLLSTDEEILEVYETGKGTLQYRCEYAFKQVEDHQVLEVTGLAPNFKVSKFLETCQALAKEGLILYATDMSSSEGFSLVVGFNDSQAIQDRVIPLLHTKVSYSFFTVENGPTVEESKISFTNLKGVLQSFLDFRHTVEEKLILLQLEKLATRIHVEDVKALAVRKLNKVIKELKSLEPDLKGRIAKALKISVEDAEIICNARVQSLAKINEEEQKAKVTKLREERDSLREDLTDIDRIILTRIKEMLAYGDERGTLIRDEEPHLPSVEVERYVTARYDGTIQRWFEPLTKRGNWTWNYLLDGGEHITVALADGNLHQISLSQLTTDKLPGKVVGVASSNHAKMLLVCPNSMIVALDNPQKVPVYQGTKTGELQQMVGFNDDDLLAFIGTNNEVLTVEGSKIPGHRRGTKARYRYRMRNIVQVLVIPGGAGKLFDGVGKEVDLTVRETKRRYIGPFFLAGERNFGVQDGRKRFLDLRKAEKFRDRITVLHVL
jgi:DNA gyrase/topoisomerase IV subunit A